MKPVGLDPHPEEHRDAGPMRWCSCARTMQAGHLVEHGRLPDQAEAWRAGRLFRTIPGLENAEFARLGGLHRNTFIQSAANCSICTLRLKSGNPISASRARSPDARAMSRAAAIGLLAGRFAAAELLGRKRLSPLHRRLPPRSVPLLGHITGGADADSYQPMNVNFGLFRRSRQDEEGQPQASLYGASQGRSRRLA